MDLSKRYEDVDGNPRDILWMVTNNPEWAANRIQIGEVAIAENAALRQRVQELEAELTTAQERIADLEMWYKEATAE
jgi:hypothetical protein